MIDRGSPEYGDVFAEQKEDAIHKVKDDRVRWRILFQDAMSKGMDKFAAEDYADMKVYGQPQFRSPFYR